MQASQEHAEANKSTCKHALQHVHGIHVKLIGWQVSVKTVRTFKKNLILQNGLHLFYESGYTQRRIIKTSDSVTELYTFLFLGVSNFLVPQRSNLSR